MSRLLPGLALLTAVVIVGCGGSDGSETAAEHPQTTTPTTTVESGGLDRLPVVVGPTQSTPPPQTTTSRNAFLREVFDDIQAMWRRDFADGGIPYAPARLTIFAGEVHSACGTKSARVGPFYCPADHGVYLDSRFFDVLSRQVGVRLGDFAQAYVVAHEVGHHVQTLLGITRRLRAADASDPAGENARSVRFELQADCLAGVWIHSRWARGQLTQPDLDDALRAAAVAGSDFQQLNATGTIRPETWTHGSASQRRHWLTVGFEEGSPAACDTFSD